MGKETLFGVPAEVGQELLASKKDRSYTVVNGVVMGRSQSCWFTNLDISKRHEDLILYKTYSPDKYPKYDNFDAIEVSKTTEIPMDYDGLMGVPITFLEYYNPAQFTIVGSFNAGIHGEELGAVKTETDTKGKTIMWNGPVVGRKPIYKRIVIRNKRL
jgi:hypothetical protein